MSNPRWLFALICIAVSFAVGFGTSQQTRQVLCSVFLPVNGTRQVCRGVTVRVNHILDSRCPANVFCIWAGQANVQVTLSRRSISNKVNLIIGANAQSTADVTLGNRIYHVILKDVVPYPGTGTTPSRAVIQVVCP